MATGQDAAQNDSEMSCPSHPELFPLGKSVSRRVLIGQGERAFLKRNSARVHLKPSENLAALKLPQMLFPAKQNSISRGVVLDSTQELFPWHCQAPGCLDRLSNPHSFCNLKMACKLLYHTEKLGLHSEGSQVYTLNKLECNGVISARHNLHLSGSKMGFHHVGQAGLKLLTSDGLPALASQSAKITEMEFHHVGQADLELLDASTPPTLVFQSAGITGMSHRAWPHFKCIECEQKTDINEDSKVWGLNNQKNKDINYQDTGHWEMSSFGDRINVTKSVWDIRLSAHQTSQ
ncbi:hypothetical protein AAY473_007732 [Plecturocebus cupreus]